ncbi:hypothetical protein CDAR_480281 [Caerostris darwini]|uniref:Uncharacterized protein n=1 Tax=Caerostris darwini TaxID=1538125 RepID=A0AAV4V1A7_9ARAC|nr:hypothetical protein CDAR_480281 [Caerostris darwini]
MKQTQNHPSSPAFIHLLLGYLDAISIPPLPQTIPRLKSLDFRPRNYPVIIPVPPYLCPEDFSFRIPGYRTLRSHSSLPGLSEINDPRTGRYIAPGAPRRPFYETVPHLFIAPDAGD